MLLCCFSPNKMNTISHWYTSAFCLNFIFCTVNIQFVENMLGAGAASQKITKALLWFRGNIGLSRWLNRWQYRLSIEMFISIYIDYIDNLWQNWQFWWPNIWIKKWWLLLEDHKILARTRSLICSFTHRHLLLPRQPVIHHVNIPLFVAGVFGPRWVLKRTTSRPFWPVRGISMIQTSTPNSKPLANVCRPCCSKEVSTCN